MVERTLRLRDVLDVIDGCYSAPDGYYYAKQTDRIETWAKAVENVKRELLAFADATEPAALSTCGSPPTTLRLKVQS